MRGWCLAALAASCGDLGVNLFHRMLVEAFALGLRANRFEPGRSCGKRVDVVVDAYNDCLGFSAAVNQKTLVFLPDSAVQAEMTLAIGVDFFRRFPAIALLPCLTAVLP